MIAGEGLAEDDSSRMVRMEEGREGGGGGGLRLRLNRKRMAGGGLFRSRGGSEGGSEGDRERGSVEAAAGRDSPSDATSCARALGARSWAAGEVREEDAGTGSVMVEDEGMELRFEDVLDESMASEGVDEKEVVAGEDDRRSDSNGS